MGIQPTAAYSAVSFIANSTQQRQTSTSAPATSTALAASLADRTTISQAARDLAAQENKVTPYSDDPQAAEKFTQNMAERFAGRNQQRAMYANDPSNPLYGKWLDDAAQKNFSTGTGEGALIDLSWGKTSANLLKMDDNLHYFGGEPVTPASQAYQQQQVSNYKNAATQLYHSERAKGTAPGDILIKIMDLQEQQPARLRAMMGWPNAADFASNQASAAFGGVKSSHQ